MSDVATLECVRVLQCFTCKTMEELPDFLGPPENDVILQTLLVPHGGETEFPHHGALHRVERKHWEDRAVRKQIVERLWEGTSGFRPSYYDVKDTMQEEAIKCFRKHKSAVPCIDYQDPSKRLGNPARGLRKWLAREVRRDVADLGEPPKVYLCNFCPVQQHVDRMKLAQDIGHQY